ncbi:type II secretion system protein GspK [Pelagicoccus sp. SDUM812003]|uniref:general secretion pathway protein GspK n=1 Tax=Pelagicoccus sp. SDUM812003 TaxID=3041267 RepID=UPI00280E0E71|nr:type II secretion system protein GspK [Pelagicoccus sp. SDUM812003]MDQ8202963.1 type II secretion system protein GspK [Pelagicoccus sp. SDUM812003]
MRATLQRRSSRRGSVLLMTLVLIVVVSFALTMYIERAEVEIKSEGYYWKRAQLRKDAWSMMEVAVAALADVKAIDRSLYSPSQGWSDPLEYAGITPRPGLEVHFEFIDESGKLNLNGAESDTLILLFDELGFELDVAMQLADVLLDWIDGDDETRIDGAEEREYSTLELDAHPANQPLQSLDELRYLFAFKDLFFDERGVPLPVFHELENAVTVYEVSELNLNAASSLALRAVADMDEFDKQAIDQFLAGLDGVLGTADDEYFSSSEDLSSVLVDLPQGAPLGYQISVLTIKVTVKEAGYSYSLIGTVNTRSEAPAMQESDGNLKYPFHFLELREEPGANNARPL